MPTAGRRACFSMPAGSVGCCCLPHATIAPSNAQSNSQEAVAGTRAPTERGRRLVAVMHGCSLGIMSPLSHAMGRMPWGIRPLVVDLPYAPSFRLELPMLRKLISLVVLDAAANPSALVASNALEFTIE